MAHASRPRPTACLALADGSLFYGHGFGAIETRHDLAGHERVSGGYHEAGA